MEPCLTEKLRVVFILIILFSTSLSENDLDSKFCGIWRHGKDPLSLNVNLSTGCTGILISANKSSLSIDGQITAQCRQSDVIPLKQFGLDSDEEESNFCLYWEPLLDQLHLQVRGKNFILCQPASVQGSCCTDLSLGPNEPEARYGIFSGSVNNDLITSTTRTAYKFVGRYIDCKTLCDHASQGSTQVHMTKHPCAHSHEVEMKEDFRGYNITSPATPGVSVESTITVQISPALKQTVTKTSKVVCTFFKKNILFQDGLAEVRILDDVVELRVENKVVSDLSEPVRIFFHHDVIPKSYSRKCVSWDIKKDPWQVSWVMDGCETHQRGTQHTECLCNHLAYFSVQLEPCPVGHPLALSTIRYVGCAVSMISGVALIVFINRKR